MMIMMVVMIMMMLTTIILLLSKYIYKRKHRNNVFTMSCLETLRKNIGIRSDNKKVK